MYNIQLRWKESNSRFLVQVFLIIKVVCFKLVNGCTFGLPIMLLAEIYLLLLVFNSLNPYKPGVLFMGHRQTE